MTDLTKLTAEEALGQLLYGPTDRLAILDEIRRRLERLEEAESKVEQLVGDVHAITADYTEAKKLQERTDYMLNAALKEAKLYKERLAKCEAALRVIRDAPRSRGEDWDDFAYRLGDAARAALEG